MEKQKISEGNKELICGAYELMVKDLKGYSLGLGRFIYKKQIKWLENRVKEIREN